MKRPIGLLLAGALIVTTGALMATAAPNQQREISDRERFCRYGSLEGGIGYWTDRELKLTAACALQHWPAAKSTVWSIAERESHWGARAVNTSSGACGVFQHIGWPSRVQKFNRQLPRWNAGPSCFNGRSNVLVSVRMMSNSGFSPWGS